jgi:hypothetical protein
LPTAHDSDGFRWCSVTAPWEVVIACLDRARNEAPSASWESPSLFPSVSRTDPLTLVDPPLPLANRLAPSETPRFRFGGRPRCGLLPLIALSAVLSLALSFALLLVPGGVLLVPFTLGLFLLAVTGVLGGLKNTTVHQHNPTINPRSWRDGSYRGASPVKGGAWVSLWRRSGVDPVSDGLGGLDHDETVGSLEGHSGRGLAEAKGPNLPERIEADRGRVREALEAALVLGVEIAPVRLVRDLQQPVVEPVLADDRHGEQPAQRWMRARGLREAAPGGVLLDLVFVEANRLVLGDHERVQPDPARITPGPRLGLRSRGGHEQGAAGILLTPRQARRTLRLSGRRPADEFDCGLR